MDLIGIALLGIFSGLLVNYFSDVLPFKQGIGLPVCRNCRNSMEWKNYLLFSQCEHCNARRSFRAHFTQFVLPLIFLLTWYFPPDNLSFWLWAIWIIYFVIVTIIDMEHRVVMHLISYIGIVLGFGTGILIHGWMPTIWGGLAGYGIMLSLYFLGKVFIKILSRQRGAEIEDVALGFGDVNLAGILGLVLGWPGITAGLVFAIAAGGLVSLGIIIFAKIKKTYRPLVAVPYAPFLVLGAVILFYI
jgi:prepilin signal peptidase PulO-like enzyme (type II secretory pathway)